MAPTKLMAWPGMVIFSLAFVFFPLSSQGTVCQLTKLKENIDGIPKQLTDVNGTVFFVDGTYGTSFSRSHLWKTNGSPAGTVLVKDVYPAGDSHIDQLTNVNGTLFFVATDDTHGRELWKSNGTEAGTVLVKDINPAGDSYPMYLTNVDGMLYFRATTGSNGNELWKSDGTAAGTVMVKDFPNPGDSGYSFGINPQYITNVNGVLFFMGYKEDGSGEELWRSDGTAEGTRLVKDINPGSTASYPSQLKAVGNMLFFSADDGTHGRELWKSNGTETGTQMVQDIWFSTNNSDPRDMTQYGFSVMFSATREDLGRELWISIAGLGANMVKDIADSVLHPDSDPEYLTENKAQLFFAATSYYGGGRELWKSNGTESGTMMVKDINASGDSNPKYLTSSNGKLYFNADDGVHGMELWVSDGTAEGTVMVDDLRPASGSNPRELLNVNGSLFFFADEGGFGDELWKCGNTFPWILFSPAMTK